MHADSERFGNLRSVAQEKGLENLVGKVKKFPILLKSLHISTGIIHGPKNDYF
jgi:hypothetical protein